MRKLLSAVAGLVIFGLSGASAQNYPTRTITMLIPFAAGGPTDTVGRLIAESMSRTLGQQVIIENVVGAGGTRAPGQLAKAEPARFADLGTVPVPQSDATPEAHSKKLKAEINRWRPLIQAAGVYAD